MLVLANGIPAYDVATNQSPFVAFPAYSVRNMSWFSPSEAFSYGDLAGGGTLLAQTYGGDSPDVVAAGGSSAVRTGQSFENGAWSAAGSHEAQDARTRADGFVRVPLSDAGLFFTAAASGDYSSKAEQDLDTSNSGIAAEYVSSRANRVDASLSADGGGYSGDSPYATYSARWSDVQAQAEVATQTRVQFFAGAAGRASSGYYRTSDPALPLTAGTVGQTRLDVGARTAGDRFSAQLGIGAFGMQYAGGSGTAPSAFDGAALLPSFSGSYAFDPHWTLRLQAGGSFTLPTILEAFVTPPETPALLFDRNFSFVQTLEYGDLRRFRASVTTAAETVSGLDRGTIHAAGISAAWQFAPALSLRAWILRDNDLTQPYEGVYRFGTPPAPATVGSYWITYEGPGMRLDAIYSRDLLDYRADPHLDLSISTPLGKQTAHFRGERAARGHPLLQHRVTESITRSKACGATPIGAAVPNAACRIDEHRLRGAP